MNTVDPSSIINISGLYPFTLADCGLIPPAGGFTYFVASISAPYGYRLDCPPLPVPDFNRLEYASFAWRTHKTFDNTNRVLAIALMLNILFHFIPFFHFVPQFLLQREEIAKLELLGSRHSRITRKEFAIPFISFTSFA